MTAEPEPKTGGAPRRAAVESSSEKGPSRPPRHVVLIGLMGSGKSAIGSRVAELLGRPFVDVDQVIMERTGLTVRQLWERGGEAAFRPLERDVVVHNLSEEGPDVLASPAGAVLDPLVKEAMRVAQPFTVWLRASVETLVERVKGSEHRPLLGDDPERALRTMAAERSELYGALADLVLDVEGASPDELAQQVVDAALL